MRGRVSVLVGVGTLLVLLGIGGCIDLQEQSLIDAQQGARTVELDEVYIPSILPPERPVVAPELVEVTRPKEILVNREFSFIADETTTTVPTGLWGLPFAPEGLAGCDEMDFYRKQFGLIDHFRGLGFRESSCKNYVSSYCCHGYWQLYVTLHLRDHRLGPRYAECGIATIDDVLGDDPITKQKNACGAKAVYDISGGGAWDAW